MEKPEIPGISGLKINYSKLDWIIEIIPIMSYCIV